MKMTPEDAFDAAAKNWLHVPIIDLKKKIEECEKIPLPEGSRRFETLNSMRLMLSSMSLHW